MRKIIDFAYVLYSIATANLGLAATKIELKLCCRSCCEVASEYEEH